MPERDDRCPAWALVRTHIEWRFAIIHRHTHVLSVPSLTVVKPIPYNNGMENVRLNYFFLWNFLLLVTGCGSSVAVWTDGEVPFVRSTPQVIDRMLELAQVRKDDVLYDIGSGDGAIVIRAAKKYGVRGIGIEIDDGLVAKARANAFQEKVQDLVEFRAADAFTVDVSPATVVTLYMLPDFNAKLRPILDRQLKPGTRVVSHDFDMGEWKPDQHREIAVPNKSYGPPLSQIYLWYVPANVAGTWRWQLTFGGEAHAYEANIDQRFQALDAVILVDGGSAMLQNLSLRGELVDFTLVREMYGRRISHEFSGRIEGDSASGRARITEGNENTTQEWRATRIARGRMRTE